MNIDVLKKDLRSAKRDQQLRKNLLTNHYATIVVEAQCKEGGKLLCLVIVWLLVTRLMQVVTSYQLLHRGGFSSTVLLFTKTLTLDSFTDKQLQSCYLLHIVLFSLGSFKVGNIRCRCSVTTPEICYTDVMRSFFLLSSAN